LEVVERRSIDRPARPATRLTRGRIRDHHPRPRDEPAEAPSRASVGTVSEQNRPLGRSGTRGACALTRGSFRAAATRGRRQRWDGAVADWARDRGPRASSSTGGCRSRVRPSVSNASAPRERRDGSSRAARGSRQAARLSRVTRHLSTPLAAGNRRRSSPRRSRPAALSTRPGQDGCRQWRGVLPRLLLAHAGLYRRPAATDPHPPRQRGQQHDGHASQ